MERVSKPLLLAFLAHRPYSVVHLDADWDGYREAVSEQMHVVEKQFEPTVSFGYMDSDAEQEYANDIGLRNVPSVACYRGADLFGVVVGTKQNIAQNIERLMRGEHLDETNTYSRG
jgi:thioredoxin-like negative regulator of GroEL